MIKIRFLLVRKSLRITALLSFILLLSCATVPQPEPVGPIPTQRQLDWQELEYYGFIHFNMNTFTDMEWGTGAESPELFNPTELDARQWARVAKDAGMKGLIITAKHHDGFSLWPTKTTEHSVKSSPWKDGQGDVLEELAEACREYGLKFGVYLSPWDRNHPEYGLPEYVAVFHQQLEELLTNYGDVFEVWFDGANGGTGYYGGANEERKIDHRSYYGWDKVLDIVRKHQPQAVIFGDNGPDIRWVGNERGFAGETNWSVIRADEMYAGSGKHLELQSGHQDGTDWVPAEADVSIRPGWYYHAREDHQVKTLPELLDIYYGSVGRNATLLLNLPVDRRGLVHEKDVEQLMKLREKLDADFKTNLAKDVDIKANHTREDASKFAATNVIDGDKNTYWAGQADRLDGTLTLDFGEPTTFNRFLVQEYVALGQRVKEFSLEARIDNQWEEVAEQTTIGYKRILRFDPVNATAIRLHIKDAKAAALIANIEVYNAPSLLVAPQVSRDKQGGIGMSVPDDNVQIFYNLDGRDPDRYSRRYQEKIDHDKPVSVRAVAFDPVLDQYSEITTAELDIPKSQWQVLSVSSGDLEQAEKIIDEDPSSSWSSQRDVRLPQEVVIDLGKSYSLTGFTYTPPQGRWALATVSHYELLVSNDNENWSVAAEGEFSNIKNNPVQQQVAFPKKEARYIKLKGLRTTDGAAAISIGEIGVITENE